jgi:hypothetical protein
MVGFYVIRLKAWKTDCVNRTCTAAGDEGWQLLCMNWCYVCVQQQWCLDGVLTAPRHAPSLMRNHLRSRAASSMLSSTVLCCHLALVLQLLYVIMSGLYRNTATVAVCVGWQSPCAKVGSCCAIAVGWLCCGGGSSLRNGVTAGLCATDAAQPLAQLSSITHAVIRQCHIALDAATP